MEFDLYRHKANKRLRVGDVVLVDPTSEVLALLCVPFRSSTFGCRVCNVGKSRCARQTLDSFAAKSAQTSSFFTFHRSNVFHQLVIHPRFLMVLYSG